MQNTDRDWEIISIEQLAIQGNLYFQNSVTNFEFQESQLVL